MVYSAVAGGTGSGFSATVMERSLIRDMLNVRLTVVPPPSFAGTPVIAPFEAVYGLYDRI